AAFALSRMKFWGSATLATGVFLTYLIPDSLLFIPLFKMFALIGDVTGIQLINRWYVLLFIYPTLTVPFCTWIMIGYFASIPKELDEAAIIDGASWLQTLLALRLPAAMPFLFNALKINASLALIGAIVAEFFGTPTLGMGFRISTEVGRMSLDMVWATIVIAAIAGSACFGALALLEKRVTFWHPSNRS
ncbi:MAG: ABC transporter permease subunit, partial [Bradyrhizobium sp.]|nr:ABC transporter permease subunit [Bradyrhizobium sp.]